MKPVVGVMQAWSCVVISVFAIVILSVIGSLFKSNNHEFTGGVDDPEDGAAVAATVFGAVIVYAVFLVGCGFQAFLHYRDTRRGAITLS
ncbi:Pyridoxamine phosphate oxidase family protein [Rutstroemia sp. NJR-2017a WRK4]|nr:Pyridoxamine phosphate oxidase family protein [Rutstroemia sp. NJR-2017a WRK4]